MRERSIIHLNVADFAVAVERVIDSRLRQRPLIVAADGAVRAAVYDMSDEAYQAGVRKGMALRRAIRYCPDAAVRPPHPDRYERAMAGLLQHALPYSPLIEMTDADGHLFVDVTGTNRLFGLSPDVAWRIRKAVRSDLGLDPIWSVASNKLVAKIATRLVKPTGEYIVAAGEEKALLESLPIGLIPGIESDDLKRLWEFNLTRVRHVTAMSLSQLSVLFGKRSGSLYNAVRGIDLSPVFPVGQKRPVVRVDHAFGNDTNTRSELEGALYRLIEQAGADLRRKGLAAKRVKIVLDYSDGGRVIRQAAVRPASANDFCLFAVAQAVLEKVWKRRIRIRHLRFVCDRLTYPPAQRALFAEHEKEKTMRTQLVTAIDTIRDRFGQNAIQVGRTLAA